MARCCALYSVLSTLTLYTAGNMPSSSLPSNSMNSWNSSKVDCHDLVNIYCKELCPIKILALHHETWSAVKRHIFWSYQVYTGKLECSSLNILNQNAGTWKTPEQRVPHCCDQWPGALQVPGQQPQHCQPPFLASSGLKALTLSPQQDFSVKKLSTISSAVLLIKTVLDLL